MYQQNKSICIRKEIIEVYSEYSEYSQLVLGSVLIIVSESVSLYCEGGPAPPRKRQFKVTAKVLTSALQNCPRLRIAKDFVFCLDSINEMIDYELF